MAFDVKFLREIRKREVAQLIKYLQPGQTILEVGAGAGWQSHILAERGMNVISIDLPGTMYAAHAVGPIIQYDGNSVPLANESVDVVFSSNVLEHISHVWAYQSELLRVLRPGGRALHFLPTPSWRFWTLITHYAAFVQHRGRRLLGKSRSLARGEKPSAIELDEIPPSKLGYFQRVRMVLMPERHGEFGNVFTELYYFSRIRWIRLFKETGWAIETIELGELFYTGEMFLGDRLTISAREKLSGIFGSACSLYVLRKEG